MLSVEDVHLKFSDKPLFDGITFRINDGWRVALAGRNGQGKSTLFRTIMGEQAVDRGTVNLAKGRTVGYLPQDIQPPEHDLTPVEEVLAGVPELETLEARVHELTAQLAERHDDPALLKAYGAAQHRFEVLGGYHAEAKARTILHGLGFSQERMDAPMNRLSGGWLMRVQLARLLLMSPDLLMLDEPTNHLDLEAREWLESFLRDFEGAVLLTSHDRYFLDALVSRTFELESGRLEIYSGNYTAFETERAARLERLKAAKVRQEKMLAQQTTFIEKNRAKAATASNVQSRIKQLAKIEIIELPPEPPKVRLRFPMPQSSGAYAFRLENLGKAYGDNRVFKGLDLEIESGQKMVVTGVNGAGKSTLLKLLTGRAEPTEGTVTEGHNVLIEYFSQYEDDVLDTSRTLLEIMEQAAPKECPVPPRTILGSFLFSGDDVYKHVRVLSGGERARLKIARILLRPSNVLILDEPTNHLDLHSQGVLLQALQDFPGTLIFVSHDREFIQKLATSVLSIENGRGAYYPCDYATYRWRLAQRAEELAAEAAANAVPTGKDLAKEERVAQREAAKQLKRKRQRAEKQVEQLQTEIETKEARVAAIEKQMAEPEFFHDFAASQPLVDEHDTLKAQVEKGYEALEAALAELEALES